MSKEMRLTHCVNGYIDSEEDMPNYGQLGCSGFIMLDAQHKVVSRCTSAFMEVRELAFKHVETLLGSVCENKPLPPFCPGERVELIEAPANRPDLKGVPGLCVALEGSVVKVGLMSGRLRGKMIEVAASALKRFGTEPGEAGGCSQESGSSEGCQTGTCGEGACGKTECGGPSECQIDDKASISTTDSVLDEEHVAAHLDIVSVKVPSLDHEHGECAEALSNLARQRTRSSLRVVFDTIQQHFAHEEAMFEEFGFGGHMNDRFSAKKAHLEDHSHLLQKIKEQLAETATKPDCAICVTAAFVRELLEHFHQHTSNYDLSYADYLAEKGAK